MSPRWHMACVTVTQLSTLLTHCFSLTHTHKTQHTCTEPRMSHVHLGWKWSQKERNTNVPITLGTSSICGNVFFCHGSLICYEAGSIPITTDSLILSDRVAPSHPHQKYFLSGDTFKHPNVKKPFTHRDLTHDHWLVDSALRRRR